jgi:hypothetical protein
VKSEGVRAEGESGESEGTVLPYSVEVIEGDLHLLATGHPGLGLRCMIGVG